MNYLAQKFDGLYPNNNDHLVVVCYLYSLMSYYELYECIIYLTTVLIVTNIYHYTTIPCNKTVFGPFYSNGPVVFDRLSLQMFTSCARSEAE